MPHLRSSRPALWIRWVLLALLAAAPLLAAGYTIFLKDGSSLVAKEKYRVENGRAIITLLNGTQTFVQAAQIDVRRTDDYNRGGHGGAVVLPGAPQDVTPAPSQPQKDKTLADLISTRSAGPRDLPENRRVKSETAASRVGKTKAGYDDFATLARKPYSHTEITAEVQQFFRGQGVEGVEIYEGTQPSHPLLEITTASEGSVMQALSATANALLQIRNHYPDRVEAFEMLLTTPERERAGQFVLTPDLATELVSRRLDATTFFVRNVQF
jgi:hypothetical protein